MASLGLNAGSLAADGIAGIAQGLIADKKLAEISISTFVQVGVIGAGTLAAGPAGAYVGGIVGGFLGSIAADLYAGRDVNLKDAAISAGVSALGGYAGGLTGAGIKAGIAGSIGKRGGTDAFRDGFDLGNQIGGTVIGGLADRALADKLDAQVAGGSGNYLGKVTPSSPVPGYQRGSLLDPQQRAELARQASPAPREDDFRAPPKPKPPATIAAPTAPAQPRIDITRPSNDRDRQDGGGGTSSSGGNINNWGSNGWGGDKDTSSSSSSRSNNTSYNSQYNRDRQDSGGGSLDRSGPSDRGSSGNNGSATTGGNGGSLGGRGSSVSSSSSGRASQASRNGFPILLDLDGNGVRVTALSSSDAYFDMAGDGQLHRTAWAGTGDGVLAIDANGDGKIDQQNEIVFTAWSPTAKTDFEALRNVFDTNANGRLDAGDARFGQFRVVVDGVVKTLSELGIVSVDLNSNRVGYVLSDGSSVDGEARFTRADGSTGTAADVTLAYDAAGGTVTRTSVTNADLSVTRTTTARDETGKVLAVTVKTTSADGKTDAISFDDDGNGTPDRSQTVARTIEGVGASLLYVETTQEFDRAGRAIARSIQKWNADGSFTSLGIDRDGDGKDESFETVQRNNDGSRTVTMRLLNPDGSARQVETRVISADGLTLTTSTDANGDAINDVILTEKSVVGADGTKANTVTTSAGNGKVLGQTYEGISADQSLRQQKTDFDGDGVFDVQERARTTRGPNNAATTRVESRSADGVLRSVVTTALSGDGKSRTTSSDLNGDGVIDTRLTDVWTTSGTNSVRTESVFSSNATLLSRTVSTFNASGALISTTQDTDGNGAADRVETTALVSGSTVQTVTAYTPSGTAINTNRTTTSADGLTITEQADLDNNGVFDVTRTDVTTVANGVRTQTVETKNGTSRNSFTRMTRSADGLAMTVETDLDGDGTIDTVRGSITSVAGGVRTETVTDTNRNAAVTGKTVTVTSADRNTTTTSVFIDADAQADRTSVTQRQANGSLVKTESVLAASGATVSRNVTTTSADGLMIARESFIGSTRIGRSTDETVLGLDGNKTSTTTSFGGDGTTRLARTVATRSGNGLSTRIETDANGDGVIDEISTAVKTFGTDGSATLTVRNTNGQGALRSGTTTTTSADGLTVTQWADSDGNGAWDSRKNSVTALGIDGSTVATESVSNANGTERSKSVTMTAGNGRQVTTDVWLNGSATRDRSANVLKNTDGTVENVLSDFNADGSLKASVKITTAANGLSVTTTRDVNGDSVVDQTINDVTVLNADGSRLRTVTRTGGTAGTDVMTVKTEANGLTRHTEWNTDGQGAIETQEDVSVSYDAAGAMTLDHTVKTGAGSILFRTVTKTSANGLTVLTSKVTKAGGTFFDQTIERIIAADGAITETMTDWTSATVQRATKTVYISADGKNKETNWSSNYFPGLGVFAVGITEDTRFYPSGSSSTTQMGFGDPLLRIDINRIWRSGDGLSTDNHYGMSDYYGSMGDHRLRSSVIVLNADGSKTETIKDEKGTGPLPSRSVTTTSSDGLCVTSELDLDGNTTIDQRRTRTTTLNADGSKTVTLATLAGNGVLLSKVTSVTSADGRKTTITRDADGDGSTDIREEITEIAHLSGGGSTDRARYSGTGALIDRVRLVTSADGSTITTRIDADGNGVDDQIRTSFTRIDGSVIETWKNYSGVTQTDWQTIETSIDGRTKTTNWYTGLATTATVTRVDYIDARADGSIVETITDRFAGGSIKSRSVTTTSANQLMVSTIVDTGDGTVKTSEKTTTLKSDGSQLVVEVTANKDGSCISAVITESKTDGLTKKVTTRTVGQSSLVADSQRFAVVSGNFTWAQAKADAAAKGGCLASFGSEAEWNAAKAIIGSANLWLGGSDAETEGTWKWVDGTPWGFADWFPGQPDNAGGNPGEDYLHTWNEKKWNDIPLDGSGIVQGYLIEYEVSTTETTTYRADGSFETVAIISTGNTVSGKTIATTDYSGNVTTTKTYAADQITLQSEVRKNTRADGSVNTLATIYRPDGSIASVTDTVISANGLVETVGRNPTDAGTFAITTTTTKAYDASGVETTTTATINQSLQQGDPQSSINALDRYAVMKSTQVSATSWVEGEHYAASAYWVQRFSALNQPNGVQTTVSVQYNPQIVRNFTRDQAGQYTFTVPNYVDPMRIDLWGAGGGWGGRGTRQTIAWWSWGTIGQAGTPGGQSSTSGAISMTAAGGGAGGENRLGPSSPGGPGALTTLTSANPAIGSVINITIGAGGAGGAGDPTGARGADGRVVIQYKDYNLTFSGTSNSDGLIGGDGNWNETISALAGDDVIFGKGGDDVVYGDDGNDLIYGGDGSSEGSGNDLLYGGSGRDYLDGGDGADILWAGLDDDGVYGGTGNDQLYGEQGNDQVFGQAGNDTLDGGDGNDDLSGDDGNDQISGGNDIDRLSGGTGDDTLDGGAGDDLLTGEAGNDSLSGYDGNDRLYGGSGTDTNSGNDILDGGNGDDILVGQDGNDLLFGGAGNDILFGETGNDTLNGGAGIDVLYGGADNDSLSGDSESDLLDGGQGDDALRGGAGNDLLRGAAGVDTLFGEDGDDYLDGGDGADAINGGVGNDTLLSGTGNDSFDGGEGSDRIIFSGNRADYLITFNGAAYTIIDQRIGSPNGTGSAVGVENFVFADQIVVHSAIANNQPIAMSFSGSNIVENSAAGTVIGALTGTDLDTGTTFTYSLVDDAGGRFVVNSATGQISIKAGAVIDFDTTPVLSFIARATDQGGLSIDRVFTVNLTNIAENPTDILLLGSELFENSAAGAIAGTLKGIDPDGGSVLTYSLLNDAGGRFAVDAATGQITVKPGAVLDFETTPSFSITVRVTDQTGLAFDKTLTIGLTNVAGTIEGSVSSESLIGTNEEDVINGWEGNDTLSGLAGNDVLNGGSGIDVLRGGTGDDTYIVDTTTDTITENANEGTDSVQASVAFTLAALANVENLTLTGTAVINGTGNSLNNVLTGNSANNVLDGGAGGDILNGGAGIDILIGGLGDDVYVVDTTTDTITENANQGSDTVQTSVTFTLAALANVENLTLTGTAAVNGTGNAGNNVITGNSANNMLDGGAGGDILNGGAGIDTLKGGLGDDTYIVDTTTDAVTENVNEGTDTVQASVTYSVASLANVENLILTGTSAINGTGNGLNNVLTGNSGNNVLNGGDGVDALRGGMGNDTYIVDTTTDTITENANEGSDTVQASVTFTLGSNIENLTLTGTSAINGTGNNLSNVVTGNSGNNVLDGGTGIDTLIGGAGNDLYVVDTITDTITEAANAGTDTVQSSVTFSLGSNIENLTLTGTSAINGTGNSLSNVMIGNAGSNVLTGSGGNDTLNGGAGSDMFVFSSGHGNDTVQDFRKTDGDLLRISTGLFANWTVLLSKTTQNGADTVIKFDNSNSITLLGVAKANLTQSDVQFYT